MSCWDCCCCFTVGQANVRIVESMGKFERVTGPGCHVYNCCTSEALMPFSMKYQFINCHVNSMTKDKVHVHVEVCVHYRVKTVDGLEGWFFKPSPQSMGAAFVGAAQAAREGELARELLSDEERQMTPEQLQENYVKKAYYTLSNAHQQLASWSESLVRGQVPEYTIDGVYAARDKIAEDLKRELESQVSGFGYTIHTVLVTNIMPSHDTKASMNEVNRQRRLREAMKYNAEADAKARVLHAEAEAEAQRQSGIGLAEQRKAVVQGLQESIQGFHSHVHGVDAKEVMMLLLMNQYFDTLKEIAEKTKTNSVFMPNADAMSAKIRDGSMQAEAAGL
eukprot:TRINITY_DN23378_c0_g1_i1.p1 TRINITY_DN23378_c0_g1~~TRINITY_DN23378_c0_g1_i1.p1  ORF type:complete len:335 (+),score=138.15 TRINITY_DN23378_c0_g1_i1:118-1122(+)